jgi:hypothetical protein
MYLPIREIVVTAVTSANIIPVDFIGDRTKSGHKLAAEIRLRHEWPRGNKKAGLIVQARKKERNR